MYQSDIKKLLRENDCKVWQLCEMLGVSRDYYYRMAHHQFKGHEKMIRDAIGKLIGQSKVGAVNAD